MKDLYFTKKVIRLVKNDGELMNFGWGENTNITIYKGLNNKIEFIIRNHDRIPLNISSYNIIARIYNNLTDELLFTKEAEILSYERGRVAFIITPEDTFNLPEDLTLRMVILAVHKDLQTEEVLYTDYSTKNHIYLQIDGKSDPSPKTVQVVEEFRPITIDYETYYTSGILRGPKMKRFSSSLVTTAIYFENFTGKVYIEVSNDVAEDEVNMSWVKYEIQAGKDHKYYENFTGIDAFNIEGNYNWFRILYLPDSTSPNPGTITKVLSN